MSILPILSFLGGIGAAFLLFPFWSAVVFKEKKKKKGGDLLVEFSALLDPRFIELAASGLLDKRVAITPDLLRHLSQEASSEDESEKVRAKKGLEHIRRLETMPDLAFEIVDSSALKEANVLFSDPNLQEPVLYREGVKAINLHHISQAFRSPVQGGERLSVRIQRAGKEIGQGVGYLEDGTMVVVNGAATAIGELVDAFVLSVKHNTAGRMIFCNTVEEQTKFLAESADRRRIPIGRV